MEKCSLEVRMRAIPIIILAGLAAFAGLETAEAQQGPKLRVAVMDGTWDPGLFEATGTFGAAGYSYNQSLENYA
jgi:hypothetical protein